MKQHLNVLISTKLHAILERPQKLFEEIKKTGD